VKFAKKLKEHLPKDGLKVLLHTCMAGYEEPRCIKTIHASDLTNFDKEYCPREIALIEHYDLKRPMNFIGTSLRYTFDLGNALAELVRNEWLAGHAIGIWKCFRCGTKSNFGARPYSCKTCGGSEFKYREVRFTSEICGASGGVDLLVNMPGEKKLRVVELKSMDKEEFKTLVAPKAEHWLRTNLYLRLIAESDFSHKSMVNTDEGIVLYMAKAYGFKDDEILSAGLKDSPYSPFKEYKVQRDDTLTDKYVERAKQLHEWRLAEGANMAPDRICTNALCARASLCVAQKYCFASEEQ
jgi:hypothetical protein